MQEPCLHMREARVVEPTGDVCAPCVARGDTWVHLRLCVTCGAVRCCDDSKNRHARAHAGAASHPVIRSYEPGERWWWCYPDERFVPRRPGWPALRRAPTPA